MTESYSGSVVLTEQVTRASAQVEACLKSCELLTEAGVYTEAHVMLNAAEVHIKLLEKLSDRRRGKDRSGVKDAINYYSVWKKACAGRLKVTETNYRSRPGFSDLQGALVDATKLGFEFMDSTKHADLDRKINLWLNAADRHTIEPTTN